MDNSPPPTPAIYGDVAGAERNKMLSLSRGVILLKRLDIRTETPESSSAPTGNSGGFQAKSHLNSVLADFKRCIVFHGCASLVNEAGRGKTLARCLYRPDCVGISTLFVRKEEDSILRGSLRINTPFGSTLTQSPIHEP